MAEPKTVPVRSPSTAADDESKTINSALRVSINDLPPELLLQIFSHFSERELCFTISRVCYNWYVISRDPTLHNHLHLSNLPLVLRHNPNRNLTFLPSYSSTSIHVKSVTFFACSGISTTLRQISKNFPFAKYIRVAHCKLLRQKDLNHIVECCPNLEAFIVHYSGNIYQQISFNCLSTLQHLKALSLKGVSSYFGHTDLRRFANNCPGLVELEIDYNPIGENEDDLLYFMEAKKFILNKLVCKLFSVLQHQKLSECKNLRSLGLSGVEDDLGLLTTSVCSLEELITIRFEGFTSEHAPVLNVILANKQGKEFVNIELDSCSVGFNSVFQCIAMHGQALKQLHLIRCNDMTDEGLDIILHTCNNLEVLALFNCRGITHRFVKRMPYCLPGLKKLIVKRCGINEVILRELKTSMPNLVVDNREPESLVSICLNVDSYVCSFKKASL